MNDSFKQLSFWNLFVFLEREDIEGDTVQLQLEILAEDFRIETAKNQYKHDDQAFQDDYSIVFFEFDCGPDNTIQLEYIPRPEGSGKYLHLKDKKTDQLHLMGWWDLDAWHPYCLREEELEKLNTFWKNQPNSPWFGNDLPLLLLHDFVGFDDADKAEDFAQKVFECFNILRIGGFSKEEAKPIAVFYQEEEEYHWKKDAKLGWVFESKIYNCYSLRNAAHSKGDEKGKFPYAEWNKLMDGFG